MRLLIDTHVLIWLAQEPNKVPSRVKEQLVSGNTNCVSVISAWEYGMKRRQRPDELLASFAEIVEASRYTPLDFPFPCHADAEALPLIHADPFDRMLVAHARHLGCPLITGDKTLHRYPVETFW